MCGIREWVPGTLHSSGNVEVQHLPFNPKAVSPKIKLALHSEILCFFILTYCCCDKTLLENYLERTRFIWLIFLGHNSSLREVSAGI